MCGGHNRQDKYLTVCWKISTKKKISLRKRDKKYLDDDSVVLSGDFQGRSLHEDDTKMKA